MKRKVTMTIGEVTVVSPKMDTAPIRMKRKDQIHYVFTAEISAAMVASMTEDDFASFIVEQADEIARSMYQRTEITA